MSSRVPDSSFPCPLEMLSPPRQGQTIEVSRSETQWTAEDHFKSNNNSMKVLLSMAIGLDDERTGTVFGDYKTNEHFPKKNKKVWCPAATDLLNEVKRRKKVNGDGSKTNAQVKKEKLLIFLIDNPIEIESDKAFILDKVSLFIAEGGAAKSANQCTTLPKQQWSGPTPFLRLIHAIFEDDVRDVFQQHFTVLSREELDGRNNEDTMRRCPWIAVSDKWNDKNYNPTSKTYNDLHDEFVSEIDLRHSAIANMGNLSPDKAKSKFGKLKNDLIMVKNNWELSGNGDGSIERNRDNADDSDEDELEIINANDKRNFLNGKSPSILYLWKMAEEFDLLTCVCQQLDLSASLDTSRSDDDDSGNAICRKRKKKNTHNDDEGEWNALIDVMKKTATETRNKIQAKREEIAATKSMKLMELIAKEEDKQYEIENKLDDAEEGTRKYNRLNNRLAHVERKIAGLNDMLSKI